MSAAGSTSRQGLRRRLFALLERPRLDIGLAVLVIGLLSPCLFTGFHLDDFIGRYIHSDLEGAQRLRELYFGGYGLANGVPADNHWQIEHGHAPWWIKDDLLIELFRPISLATHVLDYRLWPDNAFVQHAHSLLWYALLVFAATRLYRTALGLAVGGLAGVLFALDYTHGFNVGYITNRHMLIAATFGVLALHAYFRFRQGRGRRDGWMAVLFYVAALCSSESAVSIAGYVLAHAVLAEGGSLGRRALLVAPWAATTVCWRALYVWAGFGARGSGLYVDIGREPLRFLQAYLERGPVLLLGQFFSPPPDVYPFLPAPLARVVLASAVAFVVLLGMALVPLWKRHRLARFWAGGAVLSLVPASALHPHSRTLVFASIGAAALIAQLWALHAGDTLGAVRSRIERFSSGAARFLLFVHLVFSPVSLPIEATALAFSTPLHETVDDLGDVAGRDLVFVSSPDYFAVRLAQLTRRLDGEPLPRRWRAISFGPQALAIERENATSLRVTYEGGILRHELMQLFRDRRAEIPVGTRIRLEGLTIEVLDNTADGRVETARFVFERPLEDDTFRFLYWDGDAYRSWSAPEIGAVSRIPAATLGHVIR